MIRIDNINTIIIENTIYQKQISIAKKETKIICNNIEKYLNCTKVEAIK